MKNQLNYFKKMNAADPEAIPGGILIALIIYITYFIIIPILGNN